MDNTINDKHLFDDTTLWLLYTKDDIPNLTII